MYPNHDNYVPNTRFFRALDRAAPKTLLAFDIRPRETAGIHVEKAVNGFIVSCSAYEGPHFNGQSFVATNEVDLRRVIMQVQQKQRDAIVEFFHPHAAEAAPKCST